MLSKVNNIEHDTKSVKISHGEEESLPLAPSKSQLLNQNCAASRLPTTPLDECNTILIY